MESSSVCENKELQLDGEMQFRKSNFSKVTSVFILLATLKGESRSPRCPHRKLPIDYCDLGLTKMPLVTRSPEVKKKKTPSDVFL